MSDMIASRMVKPQLTTSEQKGNRYSLKRPPFPILAVLLGFMVLPLTLLGQSREQVKEQAESQLQRMTPDEIDQKLRDLGISREEATQRAKEYDITLEDYLLTTSRRSSSQDVRESSQQYTDPRLSAASRTLGRTGMDSLLALLTAPASR